MLLTRSRAVALAMTSVVLASLPFVVDAFTRPRVMLPATFDVRGAAGVPHDSLQPGPEQLKALDVLKRGAHAASLQVHYNGLTATPRYLSNPGGYLSAPSTRPPEDIARCFLRDHRGLWRFSDEDLAALKLRSQTVLPDLGATVLLFGQHVGGLPVFQGEVLVNVAKNGRIISVGNENFPQLSVLGSFALTPAQAVSAAARALNLGWSPRPIADMPMLITYGTLAPEYEWRPTFAGGGTFSDDIPVRTVLFPLGATARYAYEFTLTTPQYQGVMWDNVVDAQTGQVLRRASLTNFASGGGIGKGRHATFRPDVQDMVEGFNPALTASGKVFDTYPTILSGTGGDGRSTRTGVAPNYVYTQPVYNDSSDAPSFRFAIVQARNEGDLPFNDNPTPPETWTPPMLPAELGQVTRGFPDAQNPSASSPLGWFYLPTDAGGAEIGAGDSNRAATRAYGYTMDGEAKSRNLAANSPHNDGDQPYSATVTPLASAVTLKDGRSLTSAIESNYTSGNNVLVDDDRANDDEATNGVMGYSPNRQFSASYFDFTNGYEYGGADADGSTTPVTYPASSNADVYPGTVSLFYINNLIHDYLYGIGFTEATWNFQQDNFGKGGAGNDGISAQVQDGSGTDNANFGTPADGSRPRMQMYLFTESSGFGRRSDGDFDWDVIAHEHYHGVSNRSASKGAGGCLAVVGLTGEAGGQGEGWSDYNASSLSDDDAEGEYVTGALDYAIRKLPYTNYRWSYGSINGNVMTRRDQMQPPDPSPFVPAIPYEVHDVGEIWAATLWDMREMLIIKDPNGVFADNSRRFGSGSTFYAGYRQLHSVDTLHPITYRASFGDSASPVPGFPPSPTVRPIMIQRPGLIAAEIASAGNRHGPIATAVSTQARLSDTLVLRGLQLGLCSPSMVDSRNSILAADTELNGGEDRAVIWRAMASHGIGTNATSTSEGQDAGNVVEDFTVPAGVTTCEASGPLPAPSFALTTPAANKVHIVINGGTPVVGADHYVISRSGSAAGPFTTIATVAGATTAYDDDDGGNLLPAGVTFYYKVRAVRDAGGDCVSSANVQSIVVTGAQLPVSPNFAGIGAVDNPLSCKSLALSWPAATSTSPTANLVYDLYRVPTVTPGNGTADPTFTPATGNRIQQGLTSTSFVDSNLILNQQYYYIVRARDTDPTPNRIDTGNAGNTKVLFNAPGSPSVTTTPPFAKEDFEASTADNRFTPALTESSTRDQTQPVWQRVPNLPMGPGQTSTAMYAPDFDPASNPVFGGGASSDFSSTIGPLTLTANSVLEYDGIINAEATFDGGVVELALSPSFNSTPFPDNTTTFDLGNYMVAGGYNGALTGTEPGGAQGNPLQGRRAFTGARGLTHTRIVLHDFAPGGVNNPANAQVYIRFRMTSDIGSTAGTGSGWIVDNLVLNDLAPCPVVIPPIASAGPDQTVNEGAHVTLDGTASSGPNGDPITFAWSQIAGPPVSNFTGTGTATPSFDAPAVTSDTPLTFRLTVTDANSSGGDSGSANSASDDIIVTVKNVDTSTGGGGSAAAQGIGNNQVGAMPSGLLALLGVAALVRRRRRH